MSISLSSQGLGVLVDQVIIMNHEVTDVPLSGEQSAG